MDLSISQRIKYHRIYRSANSSPRSRSQEDIKKSLGVSEYQIYIRTWIEKRKNWTEKQIK